MKHKICLHSLHGSIKTYVANVLLIYTFYSSRPLTVWITINWKILREMRMPDHLTCLLRNLYAGQEAIVITRHGTTVGKEYIKAVYCNPTNLTYMQSASCEMLGWMKHKLKSRLPGEISIISNIQ